MLAHYLHELSDVRLQRHGVPDDAGLRPQQNA